MSFSLALKNVITSPLTLNLTDTRAFKAWLYGIWQSVFFVAPHVHVSTISTKTLKTGSGTLKSICVNIKSTGGSVCNVYDNTSATGTPIITLDTDLNYGEKITSPPMSPTSVISPHINTSFGAAPRAA